LNCRNCPDTRPRKIRIPNYGNEMMWFKAKEGFNGCQHDASDGIRYIFYINKPTLAPAEMQKNKYTIELTEKPIIEEVKEEKKGGK